MKVLLYGFKSYNHWKKNITEPVIEKIRENGHIVKVVFPHRFNRHVFLKEIKEIRPDIIIGLGQHENGDKFRIERKAVNAKRKNKNSEPTFIFSNKPNHYFLTLMLKEDQDSWLSYDASDDISNYSMYLISHFFKNVKFAFINIPKNADIDKAAFFVEKKIFEISNEFSQEGKQSSIKSFIKSKK